MKVLSVLLLMSIISLFLLTQVPNQHSYASHSVSASVPGGLYNSTQNVTLNSTNPLAIIHYTTDGTDPNNSSSVFLTPIEINTDTTLKFMAIDVVGNHTSDIITEIYIIDTTPPTVTNTEPEDGATRVDPRSIINVTFSEPMDPSTIDQTTFTIVDEVDNQIFGTVDYDQNTNTASFTSDPFDRDCSECLNVGRVYFATLDASIEDEAGNPLGADFVWSFRTGGAFTIFLADVETAETIGGSTFEITPDPFDLEGSLVVEDNGDNDMDSFFFADEPLEGRITVFNAEFATYALAEIIVPAGYEEIYENVIITVHQTKRAGSVVIENKVLSTSLDDIPPVRVPSPDLTAAQFGLYQGNATIGEFSGIQGSDLSDPTPITSVRGNDLPSARIATPQTIDEVPLMQALVFDITAPSSSTAEDLFDTFDIPTYPNPKEEIAGEIIYAIPAFAIPYADSANNFISTPRIGRIFPNMTLFMNQSSFVESQVASVKNLDITFAVSGNNIGFSFGITDTPPPGTPDPPLDAPALFLDIGFVGDVDFSNPSSFQSSPTIDIIVNKTLAGFPELPNGCPDFRLLFFNGTGWEEVQKLNPTGNFTDFCPFTLEPEHFSKFAVGGVKGQTLEEPPDNDDSPEETRDEERRSGGGSRSTGVTSIPSGSDVEATATTGSGTVTLEFESIDEESGQVMVDTNRLSAFEEIFDDIAMMAQDNDEHGIVHMNGMTYATTGDIFDIDASGVKFQGMVDVTIPYDESAVTLLSGSESGVRFLHYDEENGTWEDSTSSVDEVDNTVTGTLDSLSPVIAAVIIHDGGITSPLYQLEITNPYVAVSESSEITLRADLKNLQGISQDYVLVIQVLDQHDISRHIEWQEGSLSISGGEVLISWEGLGKGSYAVEIFALTEMENPSLLAPKALTRLEI